MISVRRVPTRLRYYNRDGQMITEAEWQRLWECTDDHWVSWTEVAPGLEICTTWFGHGYPPDGPWQIFETTVWENNVDLTCWPFPGYPTRVYRTETEARAGHAEWVAWVRARLR